MFQIKRRQNKWIAWFMVSVFMMLSLFGCGKIGEADNLKQISQDEIPANQSDTSTSQLELKIVVSNFPCYDFARAITGGKAEITMLIPPGNEVHSYEPTPQDMITVGNCDLFLYTGGESDVYIEEILKSFPDKQFQVVKIMDYAKLYEEETVEGMQVKGHSHEHESASEHAHEYEDEAASEHAHEHEEIYDEHVWTSPKNAIRIIEGMTQVICGLDLENTQFYQENAEHYIEQIAALDKQFEQLFLEHKDATLFVGDRFPFLYFAKEYQVTYYAVFPSCNGESEPSAKTTAFFIEKAKDCQAKTIFHLELSNSQTAKAVAEAVGANVEELHSCHNVTKEDFQKGVTYVKLMERNYQKLREAF